MINVTFGEVKKQEEKPFPKLMISKSTNRIILMISKGAGIVISENDYEYGVGHYSTAWSFNDFTDYNESITLQNA